MIWGLIASCLLCNRGQPRDGWETGWDGETGWWGWETGEWDSNRDSGCDPWIALRDEKNQAVVALDFGQVQGQESRTLTLLNRIEECGTLRVSEVRVDGDSFALQQGGSTTLEPQESTELIVRFDPQQAGAAQGSLVILSNDPFYPELSVPLTGTLPSLDLSLSHELLDFGEVLVPCEGEAQLSVENIGSAPVLLEGVTLPEPFSLDTTLPLSLEPGESTSLDLRFAPVSEGPHTGTLTLESDVGNATAELKGNASLGEAVEEESTATGDRAVSLQLQPWEESLSVRVSGVRVDTWVYVRDDNTVVFDEDSTPDSGARLSLRYVPVSDCQD
jgi:hypothetical protein